MLKTRKYGFTGPLHILDMSKIKPFSLIYRHRFFHRVFMYQNLCTWATVVALVFGIGNSVMAMDFDPIVYSGQQAVGAPPDATFGAGFTSPSNPALGDDSNVYYTNNVISLGAGSGIGEGLWRADRNSTVAFWIQGDPAPGAPAGTTLFNIGLAGIVPNGVGETAFLARTLAPDRSFGPFGIWAGSPGNFSLAALGGNPAPGTNSTFIGTFGVFPELVYNNAGQVGFRALIDRGSGPGIWSGRPGAVDAVAVTGDPAPGLGAGAAFGSLATNQPLAMNNSGQLAFFSRISGVSGSSEAIWVGKPGTVSAVAVGGQAAPGTDQFFSGLHPLVDINDNGTITFRATLTDGRDSVWFGAPDNLSLIAQTGDSAPGLADDVIFKSFITPLINDQGMFTMLANVGPENISRNVPSLWTGAEESLELIAQSGDQVPEFADGTSFSVFRNVVLNNRGQVAFDGFFSGTESGSAIFATDGTNEFSLIASVGDIVDLDGEMRTLSFLTLFDTRLTGGGLGHLTGSSDGRSSSFNDDGDLMFFASFVEGGSGVFLTNVPAIEPEICTVPSVAGQMQAAAEAAIVAAGCSVGTITTQTDPVVPEGNVISQDPTGGTVVALGTAVNLVISDGPGSCTVPNLADQPQADAEAVIVAAGCSVGTITTQTDATIPEGNVISQDPTGGTVVTAGSAVNLVISTGPIAVQCDVNADGSIDRFDIGLIFAARNTSATNPAMDPDGDGIVTVNDGRLCVLQCTNDRCAP